MILSLIASGYVLVGGLLAALVMAGDDHTHPLAGPLKPAPAFALVVGTIVLWPVLLALAVDERPR